MKYKVTAGDTLSAIALRAGVNVQDLLALNPPLRASPNTLSIGEEIDIPQNTAKKNNQSSSHTNEIGSLSEAYETSGRGPATVSGGIGDAGGISYGSYQMTSANGGGTVTNFVQSPEFPWHDEFIGLRAGSPAFTQKWLEVVKNNPIKFKESENAFIKRNLFDPLCQKIMREDGVDIFNSSSVLQDVVWSTAVQHGGATNIVHLAFNSMREAGSFAPQAANFERNAIYAIYAERGKKDTSGTLVHFSKNSYPVQEAVARRFLSEQQEAISRLQNVT